MHKNKIKYVKQNKGIIHGVHDHTDVWIQVVQQKEINACKKMMCVIV